VLYIVVYLLFVSYGVKFLRKRRIKDREKKKKRMKNEKDDDDDDDDEEDDE
jgi:uncharacterized membrane protein